MDYAEVRTIFIYTNIREVNPKCQNKCQYALTSLMLNSFVMASLLRGRHRNVNNRTKIFTSRYSAPSYVTYYTYL